eukprot:TRINITY_DN12862_c0_g1_i1.p1 TRINITY_DN12862_c0_g1~~TRINITY_DN12862_c0_g1_i1.p1  ORF type:complete len:365 (+),score=51.52 TRINITY_DN12862_c0_g1_i1:78-1172(+)
MAVTSPGHVRMKISVLLFVLVVIIIYKATLSYTIGHLERHTDTQETTVNQVQLPALHRDSSSSTVDHRDDGNEGRVATAADGATTKNSYGGSLPPLPPTAMIKECQLAKELNGAENERLARKYRLLCSLDKQRIIGATLTSDSIRNKWNSRTSNEFSSAGHHHFWSGMSEERYHEMVDFISKHTKLPQQGAAADFGCGAAALLARFEKTHNLKMAAGIDISSSAIQLGSSLHPGYILQEGNMWNFTLLGDATVDVSVALGTFAYLTTHQVCDTLLEMFRVTKPGGRIMLYWIGEFAEKFDVEGLSRIAQRVFMGYPGEDPLATCSAEHSRLVKDVTIFKHCPHVCDNELEKSTYTVLLGKNAVR